MMYCVQHGTRTGNHQFPHVPPRETIHECPPKGSGVTPCCGKTPFELPYTDRLTLDQKLVTCEG